MPRLSDIELFKTSLRMLGKEPEILERWGERWTDPAPPEQGVPDDLAALLGIEPTQESPASDVYTQAGTEDTDFAAFLDAIPIDESEDTGQPIESDDFAQDPSSDFGDLELPDAFGSLEETGTPANEESDESMVPESLTAGLLDELESIHDDSPPGALEDFDASSETEQPIDETFDEIPEQFLDQTDYSEDTPVDEEGFDFSDTLESTDTTTPSPDIDSFDSFDSFAIPDIPENIGEGAIQAKPDEAFTDLDAESIGTSDLGGDAMDLGGESFDLGGDAMDLGGESFDLGGDAMDLGGESFDLGGDAMNIGTAGDNSPANDSFDDFSLGGEISTDSTESPELPEFESTDFSLQSESGNDIDRQLADLDSELPAADNFNLESSWGGDFSMPGFELGKEEKKPTPKAKSEALPRTVSRAVSRSSEEKVRPVSLSDDQVDALQDTLLSYPLNLRLAVEDILANTRGSEAQQSALVWKLVEGASAREAAKEAGKILKRFIAIPSGFEKRSGAAFEAEKGTFAYLLIHSILPMLQVVALTAAAAGLLFFLGYNFAYRPIKAHTLYAEGRRQIEQRRYQDSEEYFIKADKVWIMKSWYYRYAQSYAGMEEYPKAELMYDRLLGRWPNETKAALDYARMVSRNLGFEKAETILNTHILQRDYFNKDALILMVDNYLAWANLEEQRYEGPRPDILQKLYENTRFQLATLMEHHGQSDAYLQRMLSYFIRTEQAGGSDKLREVVGLANYFTENPKSGFEPSVLAELAEYLMSRNETGLVGSILSSAIDRDGTLPETYAALATWNRRSSFTTEEVEALSYAIQFFEALDETEGLSTRRTKSYLNSLTRLAELNMASGEILDASENLNTAIKRYEAALAERRFKPAPEFAKTYSLLADIYYQDWRDFPAALANYEKAERHGYSSPETDYRQGFIYYQDPTQESMEKALQFFYRAGLEREPSPYLLLATGNTLFARSNYFAASGYYSMLVNSVQHELDTISLPQPQGKRSHEEIVELLMVARNNLGVTKFRTAERMGDARQRSEAMVEFLASAKLFDSLSRNQVRMTRSETRNLGFLNTDFILHPQRGIDLALYKDLPMDMIYPAE